MIKPEDVPKSLVYDVYAQMKKCTELDELGTPVPTEQQIADLLNLCVDAGLVSPPVKCMRFQGVLQIEDCEPILCIGTPILSPQSLIEYEHWKGQTE